MASQPKIPEETYEVDRIGGSFTTCSMTTGSAREPRSKRPGWAISSDGRRWKKNSTPRNNGFGNIPKRSTVHAAKSTVPGAEAATARSSQPNFGKTVSTQFSGRTMPGGFTESLSSTARHIRCSTAPGSERSMRPTLSRRGSTVGSKSRPHPYRKSYGRWHPRTAPAGTIFGRRVRGVHRDPLRFDARRNRRTHGI